MDSPEAFETFLRWLGRENAVGARKYEEVRQKLILLFRCRGCSNPEELADETIDRTARVVLTPDFKYVGDPVAYFRGVARNVFFEWMRKQRGFAQEPISELQSELPSAEFRTEDKETMAATLEHCL